MNGAKKGRNLGFTLLGIGAVFTGILMGFGGEDEGSADASPSSTVEATADTGNNNPQVVVPVPISVTPVTVNPPTTVRATTTTASTTTVAPTTTAAPTTVAPTTAAPTTTEAPTTTAAPIPEPEVIDQETGLPVVMGGDPNAPAVGNQDANPANTPAVLGFAPDWKSLLEQGNREPNYQACFEARLNWEWPEVPERNVMVETALAAGRDVMYGDVLVHQTSSLRFIQASMVNLSDEEIWARLEAEGVADARQLAIVRYNGFVNTRSTHSGGCEPFIDMRSQVRVVLGSPIDYNDPWAGIDGTKGVVSSCGNPWTLIPPPKKTVTSTTVKTTTPTQTTAPQTTTPTQTTVPDTTPTQTTGPSTTDVVTTSSAPKAVPPVTASVSPTTASTTPPTTAASSVTTVAAGDGATNTSSSVPEADPAPPASPPANPPVSGPPPNI